MSDLYDKDKLMEACDALLKDKGLKEIAREACGAHPDFATTPVMLAVALGSPPCRCDAILAALEKARR